MCGRFANTITVEWYLDHLPGLTVDGALLEPRYNIAPSTMIPVILNEDPPRLTCVKWGLVPSWATDPSIGNKLINARGETITEKNSFRSAFKSRRCLIPTTGFYEWTKLPGHKNKTPVHIRMKSGEPFAFAGIWEVNRRGEAPLTSCTIITTGPNELIRPLHHRMPVIIPSDRYVDWLREEDEAARLAMLTSYPAEEMECYAVSTAVNRPITDGPTLIERSPLDLFSE